MLTAEENARLTRVGPGTPAGELLRRYWHPVAFVAELTHEGPTRFVRILGEDLVLFRDKSGGVGLIQDHCAHRGASLLYGRVEERGISCAYHGWLYDTQGNGLETPAEPADSKFHLTVKMKAYPVRKFVGMYWAYLGPLPAPEIPKLDVWARRDGTRSIHRRPPLDCNWLQAMENSVDSAHAEILHQQARGRGRVPASTTRGFIDEIDDLGYYTYPYGVMKTRRYMNGFADEHPLVFPNILREANGTHIRVPVDDTHTLIWYVTFFPDPDGREVEQEGEPPHEVLEPYKTPAEATYPVAHFRTDRVDAQDYMVWETQGPLSNRPAERLASSDRGVVMYREMLEREIAKVEAGLDPIFVFREPDHEIVDSRLDVTLNHMRERGDGRLEERLARRP
jgi:5,5'-dehydrodivanillate O-demethylase